MSFTVYHYVVNLVVNLPIMGRRGVIMNVSVREHVALYNYLFWGQSLLI